MKLKNQMLAIAALVVLTGCTQNDQPGKTDKSAAPVVITNVPAPAGITNSKPAQVDTNIPAPAAITISKPAEVVTNSPPTVDN